MTAVAVSVFLREEQIKEILPHRGTMLLLNEVMIAEKMVTGAFKVTEEVCQGHVFNGQPIFRGSDLYDMAAQLLGVSVSFLMEIKGTAFVRKYGEAKFMQFILPDEKLIMELETGNILVFNVEHSGNKVKRIIGSDFRVKSGSLLKAIISKVELIAR